MASGKQVKVFSGHTNSIHAIALSPEWAINSSSQGVYVLPLTSGWLHDSFTWARRVLR